VRLSALQNGCGWNLGQIQLVCFRFKAGCAKSEVLQNLGVATLELPMV
jgi:hypothetical protein